MLLMAQFIPSVTALPQIYWQWGTIISLLPSVPATPDRDGKKSGKEFYQIHSEGSSKPAHPEFPGAAIPTCVACRGRKLFDFKMKNLINSKEK